MIFAQKPFTDQSQYGAYNYAHLSSCSKVKGRYESGQVVARPARNDAQYRDGWDLDPDYEAGDSDSENW